jgi:hypothetical protein
MTLRRAGEHPDAGSMALATLVIVVSVGLCALLASIVSLSVTGSRADVQAVRAADAAHAGLDAGLSRVMQLGTIPIAGPDDCVLDGSAGNGQYHVTLGFYATDPSAAVCAFDPAVHRYARIASAGSDGHGGPTRTLVGTYAFPLGPANRPAGGRIVFGDAAGGTCMTTGFVLTACDPSSAAQTFVYGADLTLAQASRCVGVVSGAPAMLRCDPSSSAQHWIYNGRTFTTPDGASCLDSRGGRGAPVVLGAGGRCPASTGTTPTWLPDASAGAGYASSATALEFVNGAGFGSCLSTQATVVACSQTAASAGPTGPWLTTQSTTTGYVTLSSAQKCLSAPVSVPGPAVLRPCAPGDDNQQWTTPAGGTTWAESFRIADRYGDCLTASPTADPYTATATVADCTDSAAQKWNVDTSTFRPGLIKVEER